MCSSDLFTVHATQFLREGGRLAFVLPAELLSVNYAAPVRRYLLSSFSSVCLVLFEDPIFPEVQEEVILLLADGFGLGSSDALLLQQVRSLDELGKNRSNLLPVSGDERWPIGPDGHLAMRQKRKILIAVTGMSPQILTETVYASVDRKSVV